MNKQEYELIFEKIQVITIIYVVNKNNKTYLLRSCF